MLESLKWISASSVYNLLVIFKYYELKISFDYTGLAKITNSDLYLIQYLGLLACPGTTANVMSWSATLYPKGQITSTKCIFMSPITDNCSS